MRLERIRIRAFGPLRDLDTGDDSLPSLVVVHAANEGGKTTFFVGLSTLLYGFYPASRERHPYAPWSGSEADLEARVRSDDGEGLLVHRRLLSSPWGQLTREGEVAELANRTLPWATHVRRELFEQVFALTLADLARVGERSWHEIQDRLLGAMGAEDVLSTRGVVQTLESEADSLWRTDNRGKPEAKALQEQLEGLNRERVRTRERDANARELSRELEGMEERLEAAAGERRRVRAVVERARTLSPVRSALRRIDEEARRAGDPTELEELPADPGARLREIEKEAEDLRREEERLERRIEGLRSRAEALTDEDRIVLARSARIRELGKLSGEVTSARQRIRTLEDGLGTLARRRKETARELLSRPWEEADADRVRSVAPAELRLRIRDYRDAAEEAAGLDAQLQALERAGPDQEGREPGFPVAGALAALAGAVALVWGLLPAAAPPGADGAPSAGHLLLALLGVLLLLGGVVGVALRLADIRARRDARALHRSQADELRRRLQTARESVEATRSAVVAVLGDLPVAEALLEDPDPEIVHLLEALQRSLDEEEERLRERRALQGRVEDARHRLEEATGGLDLEPDGDFLVLVTALEERLEKATTRESEARSAGEALERAVEELEGIRGKAERLESGGGRLRERLRTLGEGDPERGAERAEERLRARERADTFREELERSHPNLEGLRERILEAEKAGEPWTADEEAVIRAEERVEELNAEEKELIQQIGEARAALGELESEPALDQVESDILAVRDRLDGIRRRRDRLVLLASLVRAADRRFREKNQPDLLRSAGRYLDAITGGRYGRLRMERDEMDGTLYLEGPGYPHAMEVDVPVSTGTREQVYLALRLAVVRHLDAGGERLPLFLDEAFVNWDRERRERGFSLLAELAEERQIFVFTCHEAMARSLADRGARILRLQDEG